MPKHPLNLTPIPQPPRESSLPRTRKFNLERGTRESLLTKRGHQHSEYLARMNSHGHSVSAKRRNHASGITGKEYMIRHGPLGLKRDFIDHFRLFENEIRIMEDLGKEWVPGQNLLFQGRDASGFAKKLPTDKIADICDAVLNIADAAIATFEVMKRHDFRGVFRPDMILYSGVRGTPFNKRPVHCPIELRALPKCADNHVGFEVTLRCLHLKLVGPELDSRSLHTGEKPHTQRTSFQIQKVIERKSADAKTAQVKGNGPVLSGD